MDKTCCFRTECGRPAWHSTTAQLRCCLAALSLIFANLSVVRAAAEELLLGNYVRLPRLRANIKGARYDTAVKFNSRTEAVAPSE